MTTQTQSEVGPGGGGNPVVERARRANMLHRVSFEGTDPQSVRVPSEAVEELVQSLCATVRKQVVQIVPFAARSRPSGGFSGRLWRHVAKRYPVERYYLVPSGHENELRAQRQVQEDCRHDLRSAHLTVNGYDTSLPQLPMSTLWVIDDEVVVRQEHSNRGVGSWLVTARRAELERARVLMETLRDRVKAPRPAVARPGPEITELLLESAEIVRRMAEMSCTGSAYIDESDCAWYHGPWQYLRVLDMVSSPSWHAEFYQRELRAAIHDRAARKILISGSADWTTLAYVLEAARKPSGELVSGLEIHIVDLCPTPLMSCEWFAKRWPPVRDAEVDVAITTHRADVTRASDLRNAVGDKVDLVVADAFLTRFEPDMMRRVLRSWYLMLSPGGSVVTTVRLHPGNRYPDPDGFDQDSGNSRRVSNSLDDFVLRLRERATLWQDMLTIDLDDLSHAGRLYAQRMISHDLGGAESIVNAFKDQKFVEIRPTAERVQGELVETQYLRVTATGPAARSTTGANDD